MADTSPGKVQALCAMFNQKQEPVMGLSKPRVSRLNGVVSRSDEDQNAAIIEEELSELSPVSVSATQAILQALQDVKCLERQNGTNEKILRTVSKPTVGPKPSFLKHQQWRTVSSTLPNHPYTNTHGIASRSSHSADEVPKRRTSSFPSTDQTNCSSRIQCAKSVNEESHMTEDKPVPKPRNSLGSQSITDLSCVSAKLLSEHEQKIKSLLSLINSDNYICKTNYNFRRKELPPVENLGPPPAKPSKPPHLKLPRRFCSNDTQSSNHHSFEDQRHSSPSFQNLFLPRKPAYPCPPRPATSPPIPPDLSSSDVRVNSALDSNQDKDSDAVDDCWYEDAIVDDKCQRLECTNHDEDGEFEEIYDDAGDQNPYSHNTYHPQKPRHPPPPPPDIYQDTAINGMSGELYQDSAETIIPDEVYEPMPSDCTDEHYSNNYKELEKLRKKEEKKIYREIRQKEKKEKQMEKIRKRFGVSGEEFPIDTGLVKTDSKGGRTDLQVKKGEIVHILRIEGNPVGKWLVRNKKGKYGYVELTNIEVDPSSVKSVMSDRRLSSVISIGEALYSEATNSDDEGIYEMTY